MDVCHTRSSQNFPTKFLLLQSFSQKSSIAVTLLGFFVIVGWIKDISLLKSVVPGCVAMKANTAIGLILSGTSLMLWHWQSRTRILRYGARLCAFFVLLIGLLTLIEYSFNLEFGIDQLLFKTSIDSSGDLKAGRMAIHTAFGFVFLGLSLLMLNSHQPKYLLAQLFTLVPFLIGFLGLLGYVYSNAQFYRLGSLTSIAIHTAVAFSGLSSGILSARADRGFMSTLTSSRAGGVMARRLLPGAIILPPLICWLVLFGYRLQIGTTELGMCLLSIIIVIIFIVAIWWNAYYLNVIDLKRRQAEIGLQQANVKLEERVLSRTSELRTALGQLQNEITQRERTELALIQEKELALVTLQSIGDAVITTDGVGLIQYLNPVAEELTGWNLAEVHSLPLTTVFRIINEITREPVENPVEKVLRSGHTVSLANHNILVTRNGTEFFIEDSAAPIRTRDGKMIGVVMVFHNVTQTRHLEHLLSWHASHDMLTELVNRREFEHRLEQAVSSAENSDQQHALLYLDLDRFKIINDTCGYVAGNELLRQVSAVFQAQVRAGDTLARLGGDEFGILLQHCPLERALTIAHLIRNVTQKFRFVWQDKTFNVSVSIGLVIINAESRNLPTNSVLSAADAACYVAKNNGRYRIHVYQTDDWKLTQHYGEIQWVVRITQALEDNRFRLYYQPIVPVNPHQLSPKHCEILLRLVDETGCLVSPTTFIPAAERYHLMQDIDRWVIRTVFAYLSQYRNSCEYLEQLLAQPDHSLYAVNLSAQSINDDEFIDFVLLQFASFQIPPEIICFEITETTAIANLEKAAGFMRSLKEVGCCFALDDFGSGMSSFAYLKNLPVDYLKIDGSFVQHIIEEPINLAMVEAINHLGHVMGIQTVAEFVENDHILEKIKTLGVDYAQGYAISNPYPFYS